MATGRLRHVKGGLDNAVAQAESAHLHDLFIADIDCHIFEPFSSFSGYLPEKFEKDFVASKNSGEYENYREDYKIFTENAKSNQADAFDPLKFQLLKMFYEAKEFAPTKKFDLTIGGRIKRTEVPFKPLAGMKNELIVDTFVNRMKDIGIKRSVIFPNMLLGIGNHPNNDFEVAMANAFIDYMIDNFLDKYPELLSCIVVPANSPDKAAELIDRVGREKGIVGIMITSHRRTLAGEDSWIPIYEAAKKNDLPVCFHASHSYLPPFDRLNHFAFNVLTFPFHLALQMTSMLSAGIPERYPSLKFVFIEGGVTWIPWIMNRMDSVYMLLRSGVPILKKMPSEYVKKFYFSTQPLERTPTKNELEYSFNKFNAETQLMYASDYPHHDFDTPRVIYDLPFLSTEAKKDILGENARRVFKLK